MPNIDQYSVAAIPIQMLFNTTELGVGTAFIWQSEGAYFVITNWHNVTGRDPFSGKHILASAGEPNKLRVWWNLKGVLGKKIALELDIRDVSNDPLWFIHPVYKNQVDVVAIPVAVPPMAEPYPINAMPTDDLSLQVGVDVFVFGFPFGIGVAGLPIWKRGSIASEPDLIDTSRPVILIDSASRPGMSGSPVIRRSWGTHTLTDGATLMNGGPATRMVGVYSGRLATNDANDPQLGLTWPSNLIEEIVGGRSKDQA
jgi:Trypsin-like peptidase domain